MKKYRNISLLILMIAASTLLISCEDDPAFNRSKTLTILGPTEVYVGDENTFQAPHFTYNDTRTWAWDVTGTGASATTGEGEFFDVTFDLGTYTITLSESDREGTIEVEAISKELSLDEYAADELEDIEIDTIAVPLTIDNFVAGEVTINYTLGGTAVDGVDYELVSDNPLVLTPDSEEEEYFIYLRLLVDNTPEAMTKDITVTLTSVTTEIADEVVLSDDTDLLVGVVTIVDDLKEVAVRELAPVTVAEASVVPFEITLADDSPVNVAVNYSITGTGVADATPDGPNSVTFAPGETSKLIYVRFNTAAFAAPQTVTVTLNSLTTTDTETEISAVRKTKSFIIQ